MMALPVQRSTVDAGPSQHSAFRHFPPALSPDHLPALVAATGDGDSAGPLHQGGALWLCSAPSTAGMTLAVIDPADGVVHELRTPYASYGALSVKQVRPGGTHSAAAHEGERTTALMSRDLKT